jgi:hypothetical protein
MTWSDEGVSRFIRGVHTTSDFNTSAWIWSDEQILTLKCQVGVGTPLHIDTTFGDCAYATYVSFADRRLIQRQSGRNFTRFGPGFIHTERDAESLEWFLRKLKSLLSGVDPVFCSDQDSMIMKRIRDVWPDQILLLGREHLIMNFLDKCRILGISEAAKLEIKRDLFGPAQLTRRPSVLDAENEDEFDERLNSYSVEWSGHNPAIARWIRVRAVDFVFLFFLRSFC